MSKFLIGKIIKEVKLAEDKKAILFVCEDGEHQAKADGDCCSNSWIEHVELPALAPPWKVTNVEDLESTSQESGEYGDVTQKYGCKISTDRGEMVIDYRNESNGYYGGNLSWPGEDYFYGGVYDQNVSNEVWQKLTADI